MDDFVGALLNFSVPVLIGLGAVRRLGLRFAHDRLGYLGWVYVTGLLGTGLYLTLWLLLGLPLTRTAAIPLLVITFALVAIRHRSEPTSGDENGRRAPAWYLVLVGVLCYLGAEVVADGNRAAITKADEALIWSFKAKMIYTGGGLGSEFERLAAEAQRPDEYWAPVNEWVRDAAAAAPAATRRHLRVTEANPRYHLDYPILNPLLQVWTFACAGEILHWQNRLLIQGCAVALLLIVAGALVQVCHTLVAGCLLVMLFALLETQSMFHSCYADGMVATGLFVAADALRRWQIDGAGRWLRLGIVGVSVMAWSKNEGLLYLLALAVGLAAIRPVLPRRAAWLLLLPCGIVAFTWVSNAVFGFENDIVGGTSGGDLSRLSTLCDYFWTHILWGPLWATDHASLQTNFFLLVFLVVLLTTFRAAFGSERRLLTVAILTILAGQLLVYVITPHDLDWHLRSSALRFSSQAIPIAVLWLAIACRDALPAPPDSP